MVLDITYRSQKQVNNKMELSLRMSFSLHTVYSLLLYKLLCLIARAHIRIHIGVG